MYILILVCESTDFLVLYTTSKMLKCFIVYLLLIFSTFQAFQQNTIIMSTTSNEASVIEVVPPNANCDKPKKKFQVVPVPGEFTRGRWKVIDTRFGSAMGG